MVAVADISDDFLYGITFFVEKTFAGEQLKYDQSERPNIGLGGQFTISSLKILRGLVAQLLCLDSRGYGQSIYIFIVEEVSYFGYRVFVSQFDEQVARFDIQMWPIEGM